MAKENETIADIVAEMRGDGHTGPADALEWVRIKLEHYADRLDAAHKRELDALKQRCAELDAEVAAKDEVIKRLNDAISEEQRRKMATAENPSAVGDAAKLREALCEILSYIESFHKYITPGKGKKLTALFAVADTIRGKTKAALAAPPRNCDKYPTFNDAIRALADKRGWHDAKWDIERYCILASWLYAPYEEGGAK